MNELYIHFSDLPATVILMISAAKVIVCFFPIFPRFVFTVVKIIRTLVIFQRFLLNWP